MMDCMWISVNQRMPRKNTYVLALAKDGYINDVFVDGDETPETWTSGREPVMYWEYLENPKDLPGIELDKAYRGFWSMGEEHTREEIRRSLADALTDPVAEMVR